MKRNVAVLALGSTGVTALPKLVTACLGAAESRLPITNYLRFDTGQDRIKYTILIRDKFFQCLAQYLIIKRTKCGNGPLTLVLVI